VKTLSPEIWQQDLPQIQIKSQVRRIYLKKLARPRRVVETSLQRLPRSQRPTLDQDRNQIHRSLDTFILERSTEQN
jgi:hypothetical protein